MRVVLLVSGILWVTAAAIAADAPPLELTAEQDHKLMMDQLGITSIREGANGRDPSAPNSANYDEAKGNPYPVLPDALKLDNGKPVKNAKQWWKQRRPQLVEHFDREVYGRLPKSVPGVRWAVAETTNESRGGVAVVTRKIVGHVDNSGYPPVNVDIELYLTNKVGAKG